MKTIYAFMIAGLLGTTAMGCAHKPQAKPANSAVTTTPAPEPTPENRPPPQ